MKENKVYSLKVVKISQQLVITKPVTKNIFLDPDNYTVQLHEKGSVGK